MIEKKVKFKERKMEVSDEEEERETKSTSKTKSRRFKENHSLDSDEEDTGEGSATTEKSNVLDEEDIEGQEEETIRDDEGITVTPFNLREELEEGHFDNEGNYIPKKDEEATDQWLESVDWDKAENQFRAKKVDKVEEEDEEPLRSEVQIMKDMIAIMKPGEHVLKSLRRLGGNKKPMSSADRWKKKKQKQADEKDVVDEKSAENSANLLKLTGFADELLQRGDFQIYEKTYEKLSHEVSSKLSQFADAEEDDGETARKKVKFDTEKNEKSPDDEEEEEEDELEAAFKSSTQNTQTKTDNGKHKMSSKAKKEVEEPCLNINDEVCWTYRHSEGDDSEEFGPFTSTEMLKMQEDGKFGDGGVFCHKVASEGSCYNSNRVDFDLYI